jgi:hypothetical protein
MGKYITIATVGKVTLRYDIGIGIIPYVMHQFVERALCFARYGVPVPRRPMSLSQLTLL